MFFLISLISSIMTSAVLIYCAYILGLDQAWMIVIGMVVVGLGIRKGEALSLSRENAESK